MKESRYKKIEKKIVTRENLIYIADMLYSEFKNSDKQNRHSRVNYSIVCEDGSSYESESKSIFAEEDVLGIKKALIVELTYNDYELDRKIYVSFTEGNSNSYYRIGGNDKTWVSKIFIKLDEYFQSIKPQDSTFTKCKMLFRHIVGFGIGRLLMVILLAIMNEYVEPIENPTGWLLNIREFILKYRQIFTLLFYWVWPWLWGLQLTSPLFSYISKLWPNIEFDFGPEHLREYKKKRQKYWLILTLFVIPSILMIVYDILTNLL